MWIWSFAIIVITLFGFVSLCDLCDSNVMIFLAGWFINGVSLITKCSRLLASEGKSPWGVE